MNISIRQLQYVQALAEHGHFGRAAAACHVSQPALSMQIAKLEEALGVRLFERRRGQAALTAAGRETVARAEDILERTRDLMDFARGARGPLTGELRLGVIPTIAPYLLPDLLPVLAAQYPSLTLKLRESQTAPLLHELSAARLDAIIAALPVATAELKELALFEDRFLLAVPQGHALGAAPQADMSFVDADRLLLLEEGHCFRDQALSYCAQARPEMIEEFGATSFATILQLVADGHGVTLLPEMAVAREVKGRGGITVLPFADPAPRRAIGLVWRRTSPRQADYLALGEVLREVAQENRWKIL
jgi:LysR family hydrogen peroxide-inducible transcriptional activator